LVPARQTKNVQYSGRVGRANVQTVIVAVLPTIRRKPLCQQPGALDDPRVQSCPLVNRTDGYGLRAHAVRSARSWENLAFEVIEELDGRDETPVRLFISDR
jgi:hypothetical protein